MEKLWYQQNMRFLQTVLREIDIIDYDAKATVAYMKEVRANCLVINAGGIVDFFNNPLPMANVNRFMTHENMLRDICQEAHAAGIHVMVRVDFRGVDPQRYGSRPDWFSMGPDGQPRPGHGHVPLVAPCYNAYYANEHAVEFITYLLSHFDIDGIWENALGFAYGPCYCKRCRDRYRAETGHEIPRLPEEAGKENRELIGYDEPVFDEYRAWKARCADEHIARIRGAVKAFGEQRVYCAEIFDVYNGTFSRGTGIDHANAKRHFDFLISCVFLNSMHSPKQTRVYDIIHNSATTIRFSRALQPEKQPVICTGGNGTRWRYIADPALETRLWMWEIASVGGGIWNCYFNGQSPERTHDRRAAYSERDVFTYLADHSDKISDTVPIRDVAIYYSKHTRDRFLSMDEAQDRYGVAIKGMERVLTERHIQYGFVAGLEGLAPEKLAGVKALLLPNAAVMTDEEIEAIRAYVKGGGGLIASFETSLYRADGSARENYGLAEVFGCDYAGITVDTANDCYQRVADRSSPVLRGLGDTDMLMNGGKTALALPREGAQVVATYIPIIPNQPPEFAWRKDHVTDFATIVTREYGKGRVAFFANTADALCFTNGHEDYTELLYNAIDYAVGGAYTLTSNAPRSVHINAISAQDDPSRMIISMLNVTGTSQRPLKELVLVGPFQVSIPARDKTLASARNLWGSQVSARQEGDHVVLSVERLEEFASVEIALKCFITG